MQAIADVALAAPARVSIAERVARFREATLLAVFALFFVVMTLATPAFLTYTNIITTISGSALNIIIAIGMAFALVSGGFDLSVGGVFAASGMLVAYLVTHGVAVPLAVTIAVVFGGGWGAINGFLITFVGLNPLIVTLGTMGMASGFAFIVSQGEVIGGLPQSFDNIGQSSITVSSGHILPIFVLITAALVLIGDILLRRWTVLHSVYAIGGNEEAARLRGIRVNAVKMGVYVTVALLAGFSGVLGSARFASGSPTAGTGIELTIIAGGVIGGASLRGGEGSVVGAALGVLLLGFVSDALILESVSVYWQQLVSGTILVAAVTTDRVLNKRGFGRGG